MKPPTKGRGPVQPAPAAKHPSAAGSSRDGQAASGGHSGSKGRDTNAGRGGGRDRERRPAQAQRLDPFAAQTFTVGGLAAFAEYVRFAPTALVNVECTAQARPAVEALLAEHALKLPIAERAKAGSDDAAWAEQAPVVARVTLQASALDEILPLLPKRPRDVLLALDHITDPRNLGAIVRSAAFFGIREVIVPERRQVLLTQSAVNTAQGGFALTRLICVVNLGRCLDELKEQGYWVIGTAMNGEPFTKLSDVYAKTVLVMGAEDTGLSEGIRGRCDRLAAIPGRGAGLDSLNVSVATGILLAEFTKSVGTTA